MWIEVLPVKSLSMILGDTCHQFRTMNTCMLFLLLISSIYTAKSLTEGEIIALEDIFQSWHESLTQLSPPWTNNVSIACEKPFAGLECIYEPESHVVALYETFRKF
jgi:hypothetical protein